MRNRRVRYRRRSWLSKAVSSDRLPFSRSRRLKLESLEERALLNGGATPLGTVDFRELTGLEPSAGDLWYGFEALRDGILTLEASADDVTLTLYDEAQTELASSSPVGGKQRIDWTAGASATYYAKLAGGHSAVDLRLLNLVVESAGQLTVYGSGQNDRFQYDGSVTINGVDYGPAAGAEFFGDGGWDVAEATSSGSDNVSVRPFSMQVTGPSSYLRVYSTPEIRVQAGGAGYDTVTLRDSSQDDFLEVKGDWVKLVPISETPDYVLNSTGFPTARVSRTSGDDTVDLDPEDAFLLLAGEWNYAPVAQDDTYEVLKDGSVAVSPPGILANDTDLEDEPLEVIDTDQGNVQGLLTVGPDGRLAYDPNGKFDSLVPGEVAVEQFTYSITDGHAYDLTNGPIGSVGTATVTINVWGCPMQHTPTGTAGEPADSVRFRFWDEMDTTSFDLAEDLVSFVGPDGPLPADVFTLDDGREVVNWVDAYTLEINFAPQYASGSYEMVVGPEILNTAGQPLDLDLDSTRGEDLDDQYTARFTLVPVSPKIVAHAPEGATAGPVGSIQVLFSEAMDQDSFSILDDVVSFNGPDAPIPLESPPNWIDPATLELTFEPQTTVGPYELIIGPAIQDLAGNEIDQNSDGAPGQSIEDRYTATFVIDAPRITGHTPKGAVSALVTSVQVSFDRPMKQVAYQPSDIASLISPQGPVDLTGPESEVRWVDAETLEITFPSQGSAGEYRMEIGPTIVDLGDNPLDQNRNGILGEVSDDQYVATFALDAPRIIWHTPGGTTPSPVESVRFSFDRPMMEIQYPLAQLVESFTGPNGRIDPTGMAWLDAQTLEITYERQNGLGEYEILIGPNILDLYGNPLDQDGDLSPGRVPDDQYTGHFTLARSGIISQDTTWTADQGVIVIDGAVTISSDVTLTIEAGTIVKFAGSQSRIAVLGNLEVQGALAAPVVLTSYKDDTVGGDTNDDGPATLPGTSDWGGVQFEEGATGDLNHVEVRHASTAVDADAEHASVTLRNTVLRDGGFGVYVYRPFAQVIAENCLIADNAKTGVFVRADSRHVFRNCTIVGNGFQGTGWTGAGVHLGGASLTLDGCILAFNHNGLDHSGDPPLLTVRSSIFHNPDGQEVIWDGDPGKPQLDQNGNLTADPRFVDRSADNYELAAGSPAIDSGRGSLARDMLGRLRYDDLGAPNVGTGFPAYVDMGAYERWGDSSAVDLAVVSVSGAQPSAVGAGDTIHLEWTVTNVGTTDVYGGWHDAIYLSDDPYVGEDQRLSTLDFTDGLASGASYTRTMDLTVPGTSGPKYVLVRADAGGAIAEPSNANNLGVAPGVLAVDVPLLEIGQPVSATANDGTWQYYRFDADVGRTVLFSLEGSGASLELYVRRDLPPTVSAFDAAGRLPARPRQEVRLFDPGEGPYYVGVRTQRGSASYSLTADWSELDIRQVEPAVVGNIAAATLKISGDAFQRGAEVGLRAPDGSLIAGSSVFQDSSTLYATFDLAAAGAVPGVYDLVVTNPGSPPDEKLDAVSVIDGGEPRFDAELWLPAISRPGRVIEVRVDYANTGSVDVAAPHLRLDSGVSDCAWKLPWQDSWAEGPEFSVMGLSSEGRPTVLRPGQRESLAVDLRLPFRPDPVTVTLSAVGATSTDGSSEPIDWVAFESQLRPSHIEDAVWEPALEYLQGQLGGTWGGYVDTLRQSVDRWHAVGRRVYDVRELWRKTFDQAFGVSTGVAAGSVIDVDSGRPIEGVEVEAWSEASFNFATAMAGKEGAFFWDGLGPGEVGITVEGYLVVQPQTIELPPDSDLKALQVLVTEAGHLGGKVVSQITGHPVGGADIAAWNSQGELVDIDVTDQFGAYYFDALPADSYMITCSAEAHALATNERVDVVLKRTTYSNFTLAPEATISGNVLLAADGSVLKNATIEARGEFTGAVSIAHTDAEGMYQLSRLPEDQYAVTASAPAYVAATAEGIAVAAGAAYDKLNFSLELGGSIQGRISGPDGNPVQTATVIGTSDTSAAKLTQTDANGEFTLAGLPTGTYEVWAYSSGLAQDSPRLVDVIQGDLASGADISLLKAGAVEGSVVSSIDGAPVEGVTATLQADDRSYFSDRAGNDGEFAVRDVLPGTYELVVSAPGFDEETVTDVVVVASQTGTRKVTLDPLSRITGVVRDFVSGQPLSKVKVEAWKEGRQVSSAVSATDGTYESYVPAGTYQLMIRGTAGIGDAGTQVTVDLGGEAVADLDAAIVAEISGHVSRADGSTPMRAVDVYLLSDSHIVTVASTDSDGHYAFYITNAGTFDVLAVGSGVSFVPHRDLRVNAGDSRLDVDFQAGTGTISGNVVGAISGEPLVNADVLVEILGAPETAIASGYLRTDSSGSYEYASAVPGDYRVTVFADGYAAAAQSRTVVQPAGATIDFSLQKALHVSGTVVDASTGAGIEDALVYLVPDAGDERWIAVSDETGEWSFGILDQGVYDLIVLAEGFRRGVIEDLLVQTTSTLDALALDAADTSLAGQVLDNAGNPIQGAVVVATDEQGRPAGSAVAGQNGQYELGLLTGGTYDVVSKADGFSSAVLAEVLIPDGESVAAPAMQLVAYAVPDPDPYEAYTPKLPPNVREASERLSNFFDPFILNQLPVPAELTLPPQLMPRSDVCPKCRDEWDEAKRRWDETHLEDVHEEFVQSREILQHMIKTIDGLIRRNTSDWQFCVREGAPGSLDWYDLLKAAFYAAKCSDIRQQVNNQRALLRNAFDEAWRNAQKLSARGLYYLEALKAIRACEKVPDSSRASAPAQEWSGQSVTRLLAAQEATASSTATGAPHCSGEEPDPEDEQKDSKRTEPRTSYTPEDKFGPAGYDLEGTLPASEQRFIKPDGRLDYRVEFWNKEDAPVPTQDAVIEDVLDPAVFDLDTFEFTRVGFLKWDLPLSGGQTIDTRIDCRPEMNIAVDVKADIDPQTGKIRWHFHCVDPLTGDYPEDPMAGFLPPYDPDTGFEIGWVDFRVRLKADLPSATEIANQAFVEFDFAGDIADHPAPKEGPWINTVDAKPPESNVLALDAVTPTATFSVEWTGQDDAGGSGVARYDVYFRVDDDDGYVDKHYELWKENTTETSAIFAGDDGHTYSFYSVAVDNVGHREAPPSQSDAQTTIELPSTAHMQAVLRAPDAGLPADPNGEAGTLPESLEWIDEWDSFWVEIWGRTPNTDDYGLGGFSVDLLYNTDLFTAMTIEYGPAFTEGQSGTIDDAAGRVDHIGAATLRTDVGDDQNVLLARVFFEPTGSDAGCPHNADGQYITPVEDLGLAFEEAQVELVGVGQSGVQLASQPDTDSWPVIYDVDDDGQVGFGDLAFFATAFQQKVGDPGAQFGWACDFDRSGRVDVGDLAFFAENFQRAPGDPIVYPGSFPADWLTEPAEPAGLPKFAAAEILQADGADLDVGDYSVPVLADWNSDGLLDLIVGEKTASIQGKVRVYLNTGTAAEPTYGTFFYVQSGGADLAVTAAGCLGVFPRVFDWSEDGKKDLVLGLADGTVQVLVNENTDADPQFGSPSFVEVGLPGSKARIDVGSRATVDIVDWNNDGRYDLVLGALDGRVRVYLNEAASGPADFRSESLVQDGSGDLVVPTGRSSVAVTDLDADGRKDLLLGNTEGQLLFYANVGTDAAPVFDGFEALQAAGSPIDLPGTPRSRPWIGDYNGDDILDILVGAEDGLVRLHRGQPEAAALTLQAAPASLHDSALEAYSDESGGDEHQSRPSRDALACASWLVDPDNTGATSSNSRDTKDAAETVDFLLANGYW